MTAYHEGTTMRYATITGWGKCVPPAVLSNADLERMMDTDDEWITTRTGIKERRISHVEVSDMAAVAAQHALAAAGRRADEIDLIVTATCTPDQTVPSAACLIQDKIGTNGAAAFDLNAACSGFIYALAMADQMVRSGVYEHALVIGAEKLHSWLNFADRSTAVLFGDGAGAVVVEATDEPGGLLSFELGADGALGDLLCVPSSGTKGNINDHMVPATVIMDGREVFRRAVTKMGDASVNVVEKAGLTLDDVDLLIPHQANVRIIDATARRLKLDPSQVYVNIASYGNTSAATIPIAITEALEAGLVKPGSNLVFAAFGGGLTWAAGVFQWGGRVTPLGTSEARLPGTDKTAVEILQPNIDYHGIGG